MRFFVSFRAQQSGVEKSVLNRFLHFGPLRGPSVGMTIGAKINYNWYYLMFAGDGWLYGRKQGNGENPFF